VAVPRPQVAGSARATHTAAAAGGCTAVTAQPAVPGSAEVCLAERRARWRRWCTRWGVREPGGKETSGGRGSLADGHGGLAAVRTAGANGSGD